MLKQPGLAWLVVAINWCGSDSDSVYEAMLSDVGHTSAKITVIHRGDVIAGCRARLWVAFLHRAANWFKLFFRVKN